MAASCYDLHSGHINPNYNDLPCADIDQVGHNVTCCVRGGTCMSNGLCQNPDGDGYYTADCTDPTMQDPVCLTRCGGLAGAQVTYDSTLNVWACCSYNGGQANCSDPTSEIFPAPAPSDLKSIVSLPRSGSATYSIPSATATSLSQPSNSSNNSNSPSSSTQISAGAAAGIGVGTAAGVILLAAAAAIVFWKRRGKREFSETKAQPATDDSDQQYMLRELEYKPVVRELGDDRMCHELDPAHQAGPYYPVKP